MNVLVLGVGGNVSQGILKALREIKTIPIRIIGACISKTSVGLYLCDEALISPRADAEGFISWYINTCNSKEIDICFTGVEENIDALLKHKELIEKQCKTKFVYPDAEVWNTGLDKYLTCEWLKANGIPYPLYADAADASEMQELVRHGFPLIAKPRNGKSSLGIKIINCEEDLQEFVGRADYVIQECVGDADHEYTVGCYFDRQGSLRSTIIMHRYLKGGTTSMTEIEEDEAITKMVDSIAKKIHMTGPINFQLRKRSDGTPVCFEWNVRYSGSTAIRNHFGFLDVEAGIREYVLGEDVAPCFANIRKGVSVRLDDEVYFENSSFDTLFGAVEE